jgi:hypothetical protein
MLSGPVLLGILSGSREDFAYGGITLYADDSIVFGYQRDFLLPARSAALAGQSRYPDHATPAGFNRSMKTISSDNLDCCC